MLKSIYPGARKSIKIINGICYQQEKWVTLNCDSDIMSLYQHEVSGHSDKLPISKSQVAKELHPGGL